MHKVLRVGCLMVLLLAILVTVASVSGQEGLTLSQRQEIMGGSVSIISLVLDRG